MTDRVLHFVLFGSGVAFFAFVRAVVERAVNSACDVCGYKRYKKRYRPWAS